jgi:hypothetical protein
MDIFLHEPGRSIWEPVGGVMRGLRLAVESSRAAMLLSESPVKELADIIDAVWLFKKAGGIAGKLSVASPYPAASWIDPVRAAGIDRLFALPYRDAEPPASIRGLIEVPRQICPALGVQVVRDATLSVCGRRPYRTVLSTRHFSSRCFLDRSTCERRDRV